MREVAKDALDRWDQIATRIGRPRKDCIARAKECAAKVKQAKDVVKVCIVLNVNKFIF
jgi:hypothetical protein